jgi:hypothetical protein
MPLVRYYSTLFQDQLQAPYIGDVLERIGGDHNQIGISRPYAKRSPLTRWWPGSKVMAILDRNCGNR